MLNFASTVFFFVSTVLNFVSTVFFFKSYVTLARVGKNPGFFKKAQPSGFFWVFLGFFGFFWVFWVFLDFFGFFCPDERVFRVFFSFTNTFGCIQTLNYNDSY